MKDIGKVLDVTFEVNNSLDETQSNTITVQGKKYLSVFISSPKMKYFLMEKKSLGNAYLYASYFFPLHGYIYSELNSHEAAFSLLLGNFVFQLIKSMREKFTSILSGLRGYMLPDSSKESSTSIPYPLKLPICSSFCVQHLLKLKLACAKIYQYQKFLW